MNADKLSVKMHAVGMILSKPGDVFLKEWTKSDKKQNCDAFEEIYAIVKNVDRLVLYIRSWEPHC